MGSTGVLHVRAFAGVKPRERKRAETSEAVSGIRREWVVLNTVGCRPMGGPR